MSFARSRSRRTSRSSGTAPTTSVWASATSRPRRRPPGWAPSAATSERLGWTHGRGPAWSAPSTEPGRGAPSEAVTASPQPGLRAVGHADRTEGAGQVGLDGLLADLEPACDLLIREAVRDERQHLTLALGEGVQRVGRALRAQHRARAPGVE